VAVFTYLWCKIHRPYLANPKAVEDAFNALAADVLENSRNIEADICNIIIIIIIHSRGSSDIGNRSVHFINNFKAFALGNIQLYFLN